MPSQRDPLRGRTPPLGRRAAPPGDRVIDLRDLPAIVPDGSVVALGGTWLSSRPMAAVRELLRAGRRHLDVVALVGSLDVDLLCGAGAVDSVRFAFVSLGPFGLAPRFREALESGSVRPDEHTGHGLTVALEASSRGLPWLPFRGPTMGALAARYPRIDGPGGALRVSTAVVPDVAILHADCATPDGRVLLAASVGADVVTARAARRVVVTAERIVAELPQRDGVRQLIPAEVDHIVMAPWGAHPLAHVPRYGMDWRELLAYADAARTTGGFDPWLVDELGRPEGAARVRRGRAVPLRAAARGGPSSPPPRPPAARSTPLMAVADHERIVIELARRVADGDVVILGSFTPIAYAATLLAQRTWAPRLEYVAYGIPGARVGWLGHLGVEGRAVRSGGAPLRFEDLVGSLRFRGLLAVEPLRPAQVDGHGALNMRRLDTAGGHIRLPGTAGAAEVLAAHRRPLGYLPVHDRRTCVGTVDDASVMIAPPSAEQDPFVLVTALATLRWDGDGWSVVSRHPGVDADALAAATGFELRGAAQAPTTPDPDARTLRLLRDQVDPLGVAAGELLGSRERRSRLAAVLEAEERLLLS